MERPPHWPEPNYVNPESRQGLTIGLMSGFAAFGVLIVTLRFYARAVLVRKIGWDDWFMLLATITLIGSTITNCMLVKYRKLGFHIWDIVFEYNLAAEKVDFANQLLYHPVLGFTKISILLFYRRISPDRSFQLWIKIVLFANVGLTIAIFFADLVQCRPISYLLANKMVPPGTPAPVGSCFNQALFFIVSAGFNILTDFAVLILPIPMVWNLQMNFRKKVALVGLFSLGSVVCAVSIIRLHAFVDLFYGTPEDPTWGVGFIWSSMECSLAIICASVPHLRPLFSAFLPRLFGSSFGNTGYASGGRSRNGIGGAGVSRGSRGAGFALETVGGGQISGRSQPGKGDLEDGYYGRNYKSVINGGTQVGMDGQDYRHMSVDGMHSGINGHQNDSKDNILANNEDRIVKTTGVRVDVHQREPNRNGSFHTVDTLESGSSVGKAC